MTTGKRRVATWLLFPNFALMASLMILPVVILIYSSFQTYSPGSGFSDHLSLLNYQTIVGDPSARLIFLRSFKLAILVTMVTVVLGYPVALTLSKSSGWSRSILYIVVLLPLLTSAVTRTFGWMIFLGKQGALNKILVAIGIVDAPVLFMYSELGVVLALAAVVLPFMILSLDAALVTISPALYEAAANLGAGSTKRFFSITLPMTAPALVSGTVLVFALSISAFVTPSLVGGAGYQVIPTAIYQQGVVLLDSSRAAAMSFMMMIAISAVLSVALLVANIYKRLRDAG